VAAPTPAFQYPNATSLLLNKLALLGPSTDWLAASISLTAQRAQAGVLARVPHHHPSLATSLQQKLIARETIHFASSQSWVTTLKNAVLHAHAQWHKLLVTSPLHKLNALLQTANLKSSATFLEAVRADADAQIPLKFATLHFSPSTKPNVTLNLAVSSLRINWNANHRAHAHRNHQLSFKSQPPAIRPTSETAASAHKTPLAPSLSLVKLTATSHAHVFHRVEFKSLLTVMLHSTRTVASQPQVQLAISSTTIQTPATLDASAERTQLELLTTVNGVLMIWSMRLIKHRWSEWLLAFFLWKFEGC
jgi:hypothetical protein